MLGYELDDLNIMIGNKYFLLKIGYSIFNPLFPKKKCQQDVE